MLKGGILVFGSYWREGSCSLVHTGGRDHGVWFVLEGGIMVFGSYWREGSWCLVRTGGRDHGVWSGI